VWDSALERDTETRSSFLGEACQGDEELRHEVESLLAQEGASLPQLTPFPMLGPGTLVGTYRIEATLGQGGMGVVYRAFDTKLKRPVALKFLSGELADATVRRRFQREAQMASSLNHPHIVTVHDVGEYGGREYLVTEFVDGGTLRTWAKAEKRSWKQIVDMLVGVADGLSAAHAAGILHRDIKPENILIAKNGYGKLADFGVAKLTKTAEADIASQLTEGQTRPGVIIGTIAYMSPEQASGHAVDGRSDIFSFGVILYELLCGRRPFTGTTDLIVLQNIIHRPAEPLGDQLPLLLRIAVDKALAKDPAERYQTMRDFVVDLKRASRIHLTQAPLEPVVSRHRYWFAGVVTIITLIAAVSWWFFRMSATLENPLANARFTRLTDFPGYEEDAAISPDGKFVTFLSDRDGRYDIWPSPLATGQFFNLTNGKEKESIVMVRKIGFSGDGSHIWLAGGGEKLRLMPLIGRTAAAFRWRCCKCGLVGGWHSLGISHGRPRRSYVRGR